MIMIFCQKKVGSPAESVGYFRLGWVPKRLI